MGKDRQPDIVVVATNRRAHYDYAIDDTFEAGIQLTGTEVKSLREAKVTLGEGYVTVSGGEAWMVNVYIPEYLPANRFNHEPKRKRKLLLKANEIDKIATKIKEQGYTAVPIELYFKKGWAKLRFGLGKGKKHYDKRQDQKAKDARREMRDARQ